MKHPADIISGLKRYRTFHQLEPYKIDTFDKRFKIPSRLVCVGEANFMTYRSKKWEGKPNEYWHDHEAGVHVYRSGSTEKVSVPEFIRTTKTLVRLGNCLGFGYTAPDGSIVEARIKSPEPDLFCTPCGKALLVIEAQHLLHAVLWGGQLNITARGIVG